MMGIEKNIQEIYNTYGYEYSELNNAYLLKELQEYNSQQKIPYLATGQNCYFNEQIDRYGLSNLKLKSQDTEDAKFISSCFGLKTHYQENDISVLYTTLLGTTEFNYSTQTFPAGIFEDVFQCSPTHKFPIQPKVGESEQDFYLRLLEHQISSADYFIHEKKEEVILRAQRLINNFCKGKNRVYLIPLSNVLNNKASFGDVDGLRDGSFNAVFTNQTINTLSSLKELLLDFNVNYSQLYSDPNMASEFGIALYGNITEKGIKYIEVERKYQIMQRKAIELGYKFGDIIPSEDEIKIIEDNEIFVR